MTMLQNECKVLTKVAGESLVGMQYKYVVETTEGQVAKGSDSENSTNAVRYILKSFGDGAGATGTLVEVWDLAGGGHVIAQIADASAAIGALMMIGTAGVVTARTGSGKVGSLQVLRATAAADVQTECAAILSTYHAA
jgi:hypothetical protein